MARQSTSSDVAMLIPLGDHADKAGIPLGRTVLLIGSRHNAHLHLISRQVSKAHALIVNTGNGVYLRDLASRTHVYVNGQAVRDADLKNDDLIKIGRFTFKFQADSNGQAGEADDEQAPPATPVALEVDGGDPPLPIDQRVMLIGRRATCDIPLLEDSVSTAHAVIVEAGSRRFIRDLGSRTGTFVNGKPIRQIEINPGDEIRIGETDMRCVAATARDTGLDELEDLIGTPTLTTDPADVESDALESLTVARDETAAEDAGDINAEAADEAAVADTSEAAADEVAATDASEIEDQTSDVVEPTRINFDIDLDLSADADPISVSAEESQEQEEEQKEDEQPAPVAEQELDASVQPDAEPEESRLLVDSELHAEKSSSSRLSSSATSADLQSEAEAAIRSALGESRPAPVEDDSLSVHDELADLLAEPAEPTPAAPEVVDALPEPTIEAVEATEKFEATETVKAAETTIDLGEPAIELVQPSEQADEPASSKTPKKPRKTPRRSAGIVSDSPSPELPAAEAPLIEAPLIETPANEPGPVGVSDLQEIDFSNLHLNLQEKESQADAGIETNEDRDAPPQTPLLNLAADELPTPPSDEVDDGEIIASSVPTPESALDLDQAAAADEPGDSDIAGYRPLDAQSADSEGGIDHEELTDTAFERIVEDVEGESTGPIIEEPPLPLKMELDEAEDAVHEEANPSTREADAPPQESSVIPLDAEEQIPVESVTEDTLSLEEPVAVNESAAIEEAPVEEAIGEPTSVEEALAAGEPPSIEAALPFEETAFDIEEQIEAIEEPADIEASIAKDEPEEIEEPLQESISQQSIPEPPVEQATPSPPPSIQAKANDASWIFETQGPPERHFLGGLPLRLNKLAPPPPTFGKVSVNFDRDSIPSPTDKAPAEENAAPLQSANKPSTADEPDDSPAEELPDWLVDEISSSPASEKPELRETPTDPRETQSNQQEALSDQPSATEQKRPSIPPLPRPSRNSTFTQNPFEDGSKHLPKPRPIPIPPFTGRSSATVGQVTTAFDGLAMPPVRETDVFSDMESSADLVIPKMSGNRQTGRYAPRVNNSWSATANPPPSDEPSAPAHRPARFQREQQPAASRLPPAASPLAAQTLEPRPRRRKWWQRIGLLMFLMFLFMAGTATAIYRFVPIQLHVRGTIAYQNAGSLGESERRDQIRLLKEASTREMARGILDKSAGQAVSAGFLADAGVIENLASAWPPEKNGALVVKYIGSEKADVQRLHALLTALYQRNGDRVDDAARSRREIETLNAAISDQQQRADQIKAQIQKFRTAAQNAPKDLEITILETQVRDMEEKWGSAIAQVKTVQAELDQLRKSTASAAETPGMKSPEPGDSSLRKMQEELEKLTASLTQAKAADSEQTEQARRELDQAMEQFQRQVADAQGAMKDNPELTAYVLAAQKLQETTRQLTSDWIEQQQEQHERLSELKRRLDEKMEARRNEIWQNDPELKDLKDQRTITARLHNAAVGGGMGEKKKIAGLKEEVENLDRQIEARQEALGNDAFYAEAIGQLEQIIVATRKQLDNDRKRTEELMEGLQESFTQSAPAVEKLPAEQKALAEQLAERVASVNQARKQYAQSLAGGESAVNDVVKLMETEMAGLKNRIDLRSKELAAEQRKTLSDQQELARLKALEEKTSELTAAQKTNAQTEAAYLQIHKKWLAAQAQFAAARAAGEELQELIRQKPLVEAELTKTQADLQAALVAAGRIIRPELPIEGRDVFIDPNESRDLRPLYAGVSLGTIFILFMGLILLASHAANESATAGPIEAIALPPQNGHADANAQSADPAEEIHNEEEMPNVDLRMSN